MKLNRFTIRTVVLTASALCVWSCTKTGSKAPTGIVAQAVSSPSGPLATARVDFSLTVLQDGRILAVGGSDGTSALSGCEIYNPASGTWSSTGPLLMPRARHAAGRLSDGRVLVAGGRNAGGALQSAEIYNPATGIWSAASDLSVAREAPLSEVIEGGRVLVIGGKDASSNDLSTAELYDSNTETWTTAGTLMAARASGTATLLADGKVLVVGGLSAERYDPLTNAWSSAGSTAVHRQGHTATLLNTGNVLVVGGSVAGSEASAELYNAATNSWSPTGPLSVGRHQHRASLLATGDVLITGGSNGTGFLSSVERFNPSTGTFSVRPSLLAPRDSHGSVWLGSSRVFVAAGQNAASGTSQPLATTEIFDAAACVPTTCAAQGKNCGTISDGCGGSLVCGACSDGQACNNNVCGEGIPPVASVTSPRSGSVAVGTVILDAAASDNVGVTRVEFWVDALLVGSDVEAPYSVAWHSPRASNGSHQITAKAFDNAGNVGVSDPVSVVVSNNSAAEYNAAMGVPRCVTLGAACDSASLLMGRGPLGPEPHQPNTLSGCVDGTSGGFHTDESLDRIRISTLDGSPMAAGKTVRIEATVWSYTGFASDGLDLYHASNASSLSWNFIGTLTPSTSGEQTLSTTFVLPVGAVQAIHGTFRYGGTPALCSPGSYDDHDDLVFAVADTPDTSPPSTVLTFPSGGSTLGGSVVLTATAADSIGVTRVEFYSDDTLVGTDTTVPYSVDWNTTSFSDGPHALRSKAYDTFGNVGTSAAVFVNVSNVAPVAYDAALGAPRCGAVAAACDSETLLNGRGAAGPEANAPNTLGSTCADGHLGTYQIDESLERLRVATLDGTNMAAGKTVVIEATVWAYSSFSSDLLDLFYTSDAVSPSWTYIGTASPTEAGPQVLSMTYTLPAGSLQAIRGVFRYGGSPEACGFGDYDDRDDLIFPVP